MFLNYKKRFTLLLGLFFLVPALVLAQPADKSPEELFNEAFLLHNSRQFDQAAQAFGDFFNAYPEHPSAPAALYYQAEATLIGGHPDEAIARYEQFQHHFPDHPLAFQARIALGKHFYETGNYDRATRLLNEIITESPSDELAAKALYWMGEAAQEQLQTDKALDYFGRITETYRNTEIAPTAWYSIGYLQVRRRNFDKAAQAFELLAQRYPDAPEAKNIGLALAEAYYETDEYQRAINEIERQMPKLSTEGRDRGTFLLAESHNQLRHSEQSIIFYKRFTEANPNSPYYRRALYGLAWNYHFEGVYQWAANHFEKVRRDQTDDLAEQAMYYEAVNLKLAGLNDDAGRRFEALTILWPDGEYSDESLLEMGMIQYEKRKWTKAADHFRTLVRRHPGSPHAGEALRMLGESLVATGEFTRALEAYNAAIKLDAAPEELKGEVLFQKAWLLYRGAQYTAAAPAFIKLYETYPESDLAKDALFWAGESYYQTRELELAVTTLQKFQREYPGHKHITASHYALGWTFFKMNNFTDAIPEFRTFLRDYSANEGAIPYSADAQLRLADSHFALKEYDEAISQYRLVRGSGADYAIFQISQAHYNAGRPAESRDQYRRLVNAYPYSSLREQAQYAIGYLHFESNELDQAITEYSDIVRRFPDRPIAAKAQYGIGDSHYNAGRYAEALEAYKLVLTNYPRSPFVAEAATGIQYALLAEDREDEIDAVVDSFAVQHPDSPVLDDLRYSFAEAKFQTGDYEAAITAFQKFVRSSASPSLLPAAYFHLGKCYTELGKFRESEAYLKQLIEIYPSSDYRLQATELLANQYSEAGRPAEAQALYLALEQETQNAGIATEARIGRGFSLIALNKLDEALALFQSTNQLSNPESVSLVELGLARIQHLQGDLETAKAGYREVSDSNESETGAKALYYLGQLLLDAGEANQSIEELSRIPVLFPSYPEWLAQSFLVRAEAHLALGQQAQAAQLFERVSAEYPGTAWATQATEARAKL